MGFANWVEYGLRRRNAGLKEQKRWKGTLGGRKCCSYVYLFLRL